MNIAQLMALAVVAVASVVVFLLMRYPELRRPQFRERRTFPVPVALACALGVFVVFSFLIWWLR